MDWVTAITCGIQDQQQVQIAIIKTEIANLNFKLHHEEIAEKEGRSNMAKLVRQCIKMHEDQLKQIQGPKLSRRA